MYDRSRPKQPRILGQYYNYHRKLSDGRLVGSFQSNIIFAPDAIKSGRCAASREVNGLICTRLSCWVSPVETAIGS
ncbi:hypothetical protein N7481_008531 [Penicillium waksmanii]|uniref:uncharacterized protein n=1 Tax=Penicillium waksmanii TaxID=69791 RepID=UPI002547EBBA|nr:uncharacterized protein N7481_008531 [Penicillium waksmanii]KAJ5974824.1 hypothetical protein N7481_008531 [Penicillium waksmanii]